MDIEIVNWRKFNYRSDVERPTWFRLESKIVGDPDLYDLTHEEFKGWIYLLCMACEKNSGRICVNFKHSKIVAQVSEKGLKNAIRKLQSLSKVHVYDTSAHAFGTTDTTDTTDRQTRQTDSSPPGSLRSPWAAVAALIQFQNLFEERKVTTTLQDTWLLAYPDPAWIATEVLKAVAWEESNPTRRKKKFGAFISRWLSKAWDWRKTAPGSRVDTTDWNSIFSKEDVA